MRRNELARVTIEKLVFGGAGLGRIGERVAFVWGTLPGEEVEFRKTKKKRNFVEGTLTQVITPSPHRLPPRDDHYLSCSPWQTMAYEEELRWKKLIAAETYRKIGGIELPDTELVTDGREYGYRNKMEYNFIADQAGNLSFAFHARGTHRLVPITGCALADSAIAATGEHLLASLRAAGVPARALKSVIIRSDGAGKTTVALFVNERRLAFPLSDAVAFCAGLQLYYSEPRSPASVPTERLDSAGQDYLESEIRGVKLRYGGLSFFQVNVPMFERALSDISNFLDAGPIVDYYSGVGAISLPLARAGVRLQLVEENQEATRYAVGNIAANHLRDAAVVAARAEAAREYIIPEATVILDPPRTGLHPDVINQLLATIPRRIIYLSCGLDTQARDISRLLPRYQPIFWRLYNFFPRTPHLEGLGVLERK